MEGPKFISVFLTILLVFGCAGCGKSSINQEVTTDGPLQFTFHYEKEEPEFVSPSGKIHNKDSKNLKVERANRPGGFYSAYYLFDSGEVGEWKINYNKLSNEKVEMYYSEDY